MNDNYCLITNKGLEKEARARVDNTKIKLVEFAVGDGELPDNKAEVSARTALMNQQFRAAVNGVFIDSKHPKQIKINAVVPHDVGGWFIREVGIYDADGDLYAIGRVDPTFKNEPDSGAKKQVGFNFYIASANAAQITLTIDPDTVYATRDMLTATIEMHVSQVDPHPQYIPKSQLGKNKGQIPVVGDFGLGELIQENKPDIDTLKSFGFYHITEAAGTLPLGYGVNDLESEFYLEVLAGGDKLIYQRLQPVNENRKFERRFVEDSWQPWREIAFLDDLKSHLSAHEALPDPHPQYVKKATYDYEKHFTGEPLEAGSIAHNVFQGYVVRCSLYGDDDSGHAGGDFEPTFLNTDKDVYCHFILPLNTRRDSRMFWFKVRGYSNGSAKAIDATVFGYCIAEERRLKKHGATGNCDPLVYEDRHGNVIFRLHFPDIYYTTLAIDYMKVGNGRDFTRGEIKSEISKEKTITYNG
ncbi:phage tail-collar fiber domain-containing protein [Spartinivicinus ruber]|uniref:phage tail-collar fiber domain-containing protein n=1 Tax=Spartinivicinus ruber TaxID=2683272 RepID=UPI0013D7FAAC|nr:phage tail protein [Spartinivicinus ruber]